LGTNSRHTAYTPLLTDCRAVRPICHKGLRSMKNTQAWGWLMAGVLALGLNGIYQDGGAAWAHRAVSQVIAKISEPTEGALALASGHADWFMAKSRVVTARDNTSFCRLAAAMARIQAKVARTQTGFAGLQAMSAREEAQMARFEGNRARIEAEVARKSFARADFDPVCPRVRVNIPRVRISVPGMHIETVSLLNE